MKRIFSLAIFMLLGVSIGIHAQSGAIGNYSGNIPRINAGIPPAAADFTPYAKSSMKSDEYRISIRRQNSRVAWIIGG
ncbi:MAG: hypothetical protein B0D92_06535 [Spirochaeta sp. LUC14_002_19_P3]|nr:MAG: hypothetical protein B0D92_06535 [Spirochaeta sp. LUC14_002_19_P3]